MSDLSLNHQAQPQPEKPGPSWPWANIVLGLGVAACFGAALYLHAGLLSLRMETQTIAREISSMRQTLAVSDVSHSQGLADVRAAIDEAKKQSASSVESTRREARRQAQAIASGVKSSLDQKQAEEAERAKALEMQLSEIRSETKEASSRLTDITAQVGTVKTSVESNRSELDRTIADLRRTTGDLGVMSGLIATNGREIQALRELGERDYYEFTLSRGKLLQKVADIQVLVKKMDPKKNRFTLEIVAEDKRVEKRDRNVNEPVQFYVVSKARQPYELVVNEVRKDQIVGYLAVPKMKMARRGEGD
jgi:K+/H+ antiporter YhaU regulatory subunit KhtT